VIEEAEPHLARTRAQALGHGDILCARVERPARMVVRQRDCHRIVSQGQRQHLADGDHAFGGTARCDGEHAGHSMGSVQHDQENPLGARPSDPGNRDDSNVFRRAHDRALSYAPAIGEREGRHQPACLRHPDTRGTRKLIDIRSRKPGNPTPLLQQSSSNRQDPLTAAPGSEVQCNEFGVG